jgi:hypothetical protein
MKNPKYNAEIFTDCGIRNVACGTIKKARACAEEWGTLADLCNITRTSDDSMVALHKRGADNVWFDADF